MKSNHVGTTSYNKPEKTADSSAFWWPLERNDTHHYSLWSYDLENQECTSPICVPKRQVSSFFFVSTHGESPHDLTQLRLLCSITTLCWRCNLCTWKSKLSNFERDVSIQLEDTLMNKREKYKIWEENMWSSCGQVELKEKTLQTTAWPTSDCHSFFNAETVSFVTFSPPRHYRIVGFVVALFLVFFF